MNELRMCLDTAALWLRLADEEFEKQMPRSLSDQQIDLRRDIQAARKRAQSAVLLLQEIAPAESKELAGGDR